MKSWMASPIYQQKLNFSTEMTKQVMFNTCNIWVPLKKNMGCWTESYYQPWLSSDRLRVCGRHGPKGGQVLGQIPKPCCPLTRRTRRKVFLGPNWESPCFLAKKKKRITRIKSWASADVHLKRHKTYGCGWWLKLQLAACRWRNATSFPELFTFADYFQ